MNNNPHMTEPIQGDEDNLLKRSSKINRKDTRRAKTCHQNEHERNWRSTRMTQEGNNAHAENTRSRVFTWSPSTMK
jgi:hypothetical protein